MNEFNLSIIELYKNIGFLYQHRTPTDIGYSDVYAYYPKYLIDNHYTMVLFNHNSSGLIDHRLYIHKNYDGSYIDSLYQTSSDTKWGEEYLIKKINQIFESELRDIKIDKILNI